MKPVEGPPAVGAIHSAAKRVVESPRVVAVGSTNPVKVTAVRLTMQRIYPHAVVSAVRVEPGVSSQPQSDEEMVVGARARAAAARLELDADLGVGLEGGVQPSPWGCLLSGWVAVVDRQGRQGLGSAGRLVLPPTLAEAIKAGEELGPAMDRLSGLRDTRLGAGAVGVLTRDLIRRQEAFQAAVAYALAPFLHPEWYGDA